MKTRKQKLAEWMLNHQRGFTADQLREFSNKEDLGIQVRTLNSNGDFVIKFSESDPFINPSEWLHNYRVSVKERYKEARSLYLSCFPQGENKSPERVETEKVSSSTSMAKKREALANEVSGLGNTRTPLDYDALKRESRAKFDAMNS